MGIGIVFTFMAIAAMAAPLLWLAWWGAGSLSGGGRIHPSRHAVPAGGELRLAGRNAQFDRPHPLDRPVAARPSAITVCRLADASPVETCPGPDPAGGCSRKLADGTVPCAGSVLALPRPVRGSMEWHIPSGYRACLLGGYEAFRRPSTRP